MAKIKTESPAIVCAGAGDLKAEASMRKYARIVRVSTKSNRKKMLGAE
jgi:hypothetical protein